MPSDRTEEHVNNCRRLLHMVRELHAMGYEQLRIAPAVAPSGLFWRLSIGPASNTLPEHGAELRDFHHAAHYSSGALDQYFDWADAGNDTAAELAEKFIERFPELADEGRARDAEYVRWYEEMLRATEPDGLVYASWDWDRPEHELGLFHGSMRARIPLPPPWPGFSD